MEGIFGANENNKEFIKMLTGEPKGRSLLDMSLNRRKTEWIIK
jgi:hypothetical protein